MAFQLCLCRRSKPTNRMVIDNSEYKQNSLAESGGIRRQAPRRAFSNKAEPFPSAGVTGRAHALRIWRTYRGRQNRIASAVFAGQRAGCGRGKAGAVQGGRTPLSRPDKPIANGLACPVPHLYANAWPAGFTTIPPKPPPRASKAPPGISGRLVTTSRSAGVFTTPPKSPGFFARGTLSCRGPTATSW